MVMVIMYRLGCNVCLKRPQDLLVRSFYNPPHAPTLLSSIRRGLRRVVDQVPDAVSSWNPTPHIRIQKGGGERASCAGTGRLSCGAVQRSDESHHKHYILM